MNRSVNGNDSSECERNEAWHFAQVILGNPIPDPKAAERQAAAKREHLEWLAAISPRHAAELNAKRSAEAAALRARENLEWLATISAEHERQLHQLQQADARQAQRGYERRAESIHAQETWDPTKHPRGAYSRNRGWFSPTAGAGREDNRADSHRLPTPAQVQAVAFKAKPDSTAIWKGSVIAAAGHGLPMPLLDWNAKYGTTIEQGNTPKFQPGRYYGATLFLDELNIRRLDRIGNAGNFNPHTDKTFLGNVYNEAFHAWFWGNKGSLGWLLTIMNAQTQFGKQLNRKAEEAMSETINQVVNDLESGHPVLTYDEIMQLGPNNDRRINITPGHNEPGQTTWGSDGAGSEKEMSEE